MAATNRKKAEVRKTGGSHNHRLLPRQRSWHFNRTVEGPSLLESLERAHLSHQPPRTHLLMMMMKQSLLPQNVRILGGLWRYSESDEEPSTFKAQLGAMAVLD
ncbi:uncharacterized protein LOC143504279 [Brachyhypopomus gauderio]|uniref:uncharacterized protein LOC143504279 n=1 Tax=Brachyhypopomus gauderio TaxID=698409 RepID=UPI004042A9D8